MSQAAVSAVRFSAFFHSLHLSARSYVNVCVCVHVCVGVTAEESECQILGKTLVKGRGM